MAETRTTTETAPVELPERRSNRPVKALHYLELAAMRALVFMFRLIGVDAASFVAGKFARLVGPLIRPVSKRAENNLAMIFPERSKAEIRRVTRDLWENLGRTAGEFAHLDTIASAPPNDRVDIKGLDRLNRFIADGGPAIFVSGHFANWEVIPSTFQQAGLDNAFVYRAANNPLTDEFIIHHRARVMSRFQIPKDKRGNRALVQTLNDNRSLLMLVDQKLNTGISAPFLGRPAMTGTAPARLALKYGAPVVYVSIERLQGAHFRITVSEPIAFSPTGQTDDDVYMLTKEINDLLSADIRARPAQWLWFHRRWPKQ